MPVRLIGVGVANLRDEKGLQMNIWDQDVQKKIKIEKLMDNIQEKYGEDAIMHAEVLKLKDRSKKKSINKK